jgi:CxxC-x17-CxxC domain-containing protein
MHKAICSHCGKSCEVPFFPSGDKPVFCRDCFNRTRDSVNPQGQPSKFSNHGPRQSYGDRQSAPRRDFAKPEFKSSQGPVNDDIKKYFSEISTKLDRLINNIERLSVTKVQSDVVSEVSEKSKPTKIKETKVVKPTKSKVPTKKK